MFSAGFSHPCCSTTNNQILTEGLRQRQQPTNNQQHIVAFTTMNTSRMAQASRKEIVSLSVHQELSSQGINMLEWTGSWF
jgi:hypothetical protein